MESSAVTAGAVSAVAATRAQLSSASADSVLARVDHSAICATFLAFDSGAKGALTRHELRCAHLSLLGYAPSRLELDVLLPKGGQLELAVSVRSPQVEVAWEAARDEAAGAAARRTHAPQ